MSIPCFIDLLRFATMLNMWRRFQSMHAIEMSFVRLSFNPFANKALRLLPNLPIIANLRCGIWYFKSFSTSCYFKSSDGHCGVWQFNLRRSNIHIIPLLQSHGQIAIVDSTRKGKVYPDSFNRTIPIWNCVINRTLFRIKHALSMDSSLFNVPPPYLDLNDIPDQWKKLEMPQWISDTETKQIETKLEHFSHSLYTCEPLKQTLTELAKSVTKPARCHWISPKEYPLPFNASSAASLTSLDPEFNWILLLCPSQEQVVQQQTIEWYVQGAADDEEAWSCGLTSDLYWSNSDQILENQSSCEQFVGELLKREAVKVLNAAIQVSSSSESPSSNLQSSVDRNSFTWINDSLAISDSVSACSMDIFRLFDLAICCAPPNSPAFADLPTNNKIKYFYLPACVPPKTSRRLKLAQFIFMTVEFATKYFNWKFLEVGQTSPVLPKLLIFGLNELDICIMLVIAILTLRFDDDAVSPLQDQRKRSEVKKDLLKHFVIQLSKVVPKSFPSDLISDLSRCFISSQSQDVIKLVEYGKEFIP